MSARVTLIELSPRHPVTGAVSVLRVIGGAAARADHFGLSWQPALLRAPRTSARLGFDGRAFGAGAITTVGDVVLALASPAVAASVGLVWANALVRIWSGPADGLDGDFVLRWTGRAADAGVADGQIVVRLTDLAAPLRVTVAGTRFDGSGDLEGPADLKGRVKPVAWGVCENVPGILIDPAFGIYLLVGHQATINAVKDGGLAFTAGPVAADLAALRALSVPPGQAATMATADATLVRPWTRPTFTLTADITAGSLAKPGEIAQAIVTGRTIVAMAAGTVAAYDAAQPAAIGVFVDDERDIIALLDQIFAGLGSWWKLNLDGQIELGQFGFTAPVASFDAMVAQVVRTSVLVPTQARQVGYRRNFKPMADSEIAGIIRADEVAWSGVTGAGKPEDGANKTASQSVNLYHVETANIVSAKTQTFTGLIVGFGVPNGSGQPFDDREFVSFGLTGLTPGEKVSVGAKIAYDAPGTTIVLRLAFFDAAMGLLSTIDSPTVATPAGFTLRTIENVTIPAASAFMSLGVRVNTGTGTAQIKEGMIVRGSVMAPFSQPTRGAQANLPTQNLLGPDAGPEHTVNGAYQYAGFQVGAGMPVAALGLIPGVSRVSFGGLARNVAAASDTIWFSLIVRDSADNNIAQYNTQGTTSATDTLQISENNLIPAGAARIEFLGTFDAATVLHAFSQARLHLGAKLLPFEEPPARIGRGEVELGATKNAPGNILASADFSGWNIPIGFGAVIDDLGTAGGWQAAPSKKILRVTNTVVPVWWEAGNGSALPVGAGQKVFARLTAARASDVTVGSEIGHYFSWHRANGSQIIVSTESLLTVASSPAGVYVNNDIEEIAPPETVNAFYIITRRTRLAAGTGSWRVAAPWVGFTQPGATVGAPAGTLVGNEMAETVEEATQRAIAALTAAGFVATGKVNELALQDGSVATIKIQTDAVTAPFFSKSTGNQSLSTSFQLWQTISGVSFEANIATADIFDIDVAGVLAWFGNDGTRFGVDLQIMRNGVAVADGFFPLMFSTDDIATNNQGGFDFPIPVYFRIGGNGVLSTYSLQVRPTQNRNFQFQNLLQLRTGVWIMKGRRYSR